jgi:hypothetical protein
MLVPHSGGPGPSRSRPAPCSAASRAHPNLRPFPHNGRPPQDDGWGVTHRSSRRAARPGWPKWPMRRARVSWGFHKLSLREAGRGAPRRPHTQQSCIRRVQPLCHHQHHRHDCIARGPTRRRLNQRWGGCSPIDWHGSRGASPSRGGPAGAPGSLRGRGQRRCGRRWTGRKIAAGMARAGASAAPRLPALCWLGAGLWPRPARSLSLLGARATCICSSRSLAGVVFFWRAGGGARERGRRRRGRAGHGWRRRSREG